MVVLRAVIIGCCIFYRVLIIRPIKHIANLLISGLNENFRTYFEKNHPGADTHVIVSK